ncbi:MULTISPECIES: hypothetical protein [Prevotella]|uniref:Pyruvate ferredoxin oxidoreductase n=1 Tax=Prevotella herbatica TaxID=2801997 RepID=A0ABM7NY46_9BACT|nr:MULTISPECIES: hypothetical protein [Prevotella]MDN5553141.1 hypothetical protein [Prevotella sp.]BCS85327.1 hypothetical protein prwr041_12200 [Prevotella herbatica]
MKQTLINKYFEGISTQDEEKQLKSLLQQIPFEKLSSQEKDLLAMLCIDFSCDDDEDIFSEDHSAEYNHIIQKQNDIQTIVEELPQTTKDTKEKPKIISLVWKISAVAAVVALIFTLSLPLMKQGDKTVAETKPKIENKETKEKATEEDTKNMSKDSVDNKVPSTKKFVRQPIYRPLMAKIKATKVEEKDSTPINVSNIPTVNNQVAADKLDDTSKQRRKRVDDIVNHYMASVDYNDPF